MAPYALIFTVFLMSFTQQVSAADQLKPKIQLNQKTKPVSEVSAKCIKALEKCSKSYNTAIKSPSERHYAACIDACTEAMQDKACKALDPQHSGRLTPQSYKMKCSQELKKLKSPQSR